MENKNWLILLVGIIACYGCYVYFVVRPRQHYEIELWYVIGSRDQEKKVKEIKSDMRKDGYDGEQIESIFRTAVDMWYRNK
ncbi:MAG: hypothetical protein WC192_00310 [Candidatus Babeliales bacterium]|jgi:hypothetical protein